MLTVIAVNNAISEIFDYMECNRRLMIAMKLQPSHWFAGKAH